MERNHSEMVGSPPRVVEIDLTAEERKKYEASRKQVA